tara:strand:- start:3621 stop:3872 length:252 start_codon:yes stop_codon:yes gene_type:complete
MTIETLTAFFGWCSVLNVGLLIFTVLALLVMRNFAVKTHSQMFGVNPDDLPKMYFTYVANYKIAIIMLNIVPYCALKIMLMTS